VLGDFRFLLCGGWDADGRLQLFCEPQGTDTFNDVEVYGDGFLWSGAVFVYLLGQRVRLSYLSLSLSSSWCPVWTRQLSSRSSGRLLSWWRCLA
jgi:hypothetical protein